MAEQRLSEYGPIGYRAFQQFETFLQSTGIIPTPPKPARPKRDARYRRWPKK
jgi:hypothetical protein